MNELIKDAEIQYIDLEKVIKTKLPRIYKVLPSFMIEKVKKIIHQDDINFLIKNNHPKSGVPFVNGLVNDLKLNIQIKNKENLPVSGQHVFASNHPLGGLDGIVLLHVLGSVYGDVKAVINELLLNIKHMQSVFVGVSIYGGTTREQLAEVERVYKSDIPVLVFPAGLVSRKINGVVQDLPWKKSFLTKAIQYKRNIVPVFFEGQNSPKFYHLAQLRKFLRLKFNLEMIYLPDELFKMRGTTLTVNIGKPLPYTQFDNSRTKEQWSELVRQHVYAVGNNMPLPLKTIF